LDPGITFSAAQRNISRRSVDNYLVLELGGHIFVPTIIGQTFPEVGIHVGIGMQVGFSIGIGVRLGIHVHSVLAAVPPTGIAPLQ